MLMTRTEATVVGEHRSNPITKTWVKKTEGSKTDERNIGNRQTHAKRHTFTHSALMIY